NAGGHHFTNVLFHAGNTVLLFLVLSSITSSTWKSACVAALFAFHPFHVESVAWVAERKDVLSGFFGLLAVWAYCRYVEESKIQGPKTEAKSPKADTSNARPKINYTAALGFFALGLMSKPMLVTWPFVMILLDFWPLHRFEINKKERSIPISLLVEKIPFFFLS